MKFRFLFSILLSVASVSAFAAVGDQKSGALGHIKRMIVNHNANYDEIFITTDATSPACTSMTLRTDDPNVSAKSYNNLYTYLLAAKISDKIVELYTDSNCRLFRAEMRDW